MKLIKLKYRPDVRTSSFSTLTVRAQGLGEFWELSLCVTWMGKTCTAFLAERTLCRNQHALCGKVAIPAYARFRILQSSFWLHPRLQGLLKSAANEITTGPPFSSEAGDVVPHPVGPRPLAMTLQLEARGQQARPAILACQALDNVFTRFQSTVDIRDLVRQADVIPLKVHRQHINALFDELAAIANEKR